MILFSDKVRYPLGHDGGWFTYRRQVRTRPPSHPAQGDQAEGEHVRRVRGSGLPQLARQGLDTVYMLSDGLPNAGMGTPANAANLTESQLTAILTKVIREKLKTTWNRKTGDQPRAKINTIGFFYESPDVRAFLWAAVPRA